MKRFEQMRVGLMGLGLEAYWEQFANYGMIVVRHIAGQIEKLANLLELGFARVC